MHYMGAAGYHDPHGGYPNKAPTAVGGLHHARLWGRLPLVSAAVQSNHDPWRAMCSLACMRHTGRHGDGLTACGEKANEGRQRGPAGMWLAIVEKQKSISQPEKEGDDRSMAGGIVTWAVAGWAGLGEDVSRFWVSMWSRETASQPVRQSASVTSLLELADRGDHGTTVALLHAGRLSR